MLDTSSSKLYLCKYKAREKSGYFILSFQSNNCTSKNKTKMVMKRFEMYAKLHDYQRRFNRACDQILLLNTRLHGLRKRYKSARTDNCNSLRFPLRLRIIVAEGLVKNYYHYADMKRSEIIDLRTELAKVDDSEDELDISSDDEL